MKSSLNREFALRHLFVAVLMAVLCCWFGYDGFVKYPATPAAQLYEKIEGAAAPEGFDLAAFKTQKIKTQYGFTLLAFLAALIVGGHLYLVSRFSFEFDDDGFVVRGVRRSWESVRAGEIDRRDWEKKGIVKVGGVKFDSWHHIGVTEFEAKLTAKQRVIL